MSRACGLVASHTIGNWTIFTEAYTCRYGMYSFCLCLYTCIYIFVWKQTRVKCITLVKAYKRRVRFDFTHFTGVSDQPICLI